MYCDSKCQKAHWRVHKPLCSRPQADGIWRPTVRETLLMQMFPEDDGAICLADGVHIDISNDKIYRLARLVYQERGLECRLIEVRDLVQLLRVNVRIRGKWI
jgi:hypothetical protein